VDIILFDKLEKKGFKGTKDCLIESYLDTGLIWREKKDHVDFHFCNREGFGFKKVIRGVNLIKDFEEIDWDTFFSYLQITEYDFNNMELTTQIFELCSFYGSENIFDNIN
tara:strand:- start:122 stop:451 length:330 start_codon:yes stop_codon:yes gene_type:complete